MRKAAFHAEDGNRSIKIVSWILLIIGGASLVVSSFYIWLILAFIGLSLVFWGALLLYIRPGEYTKKILLDAVCLPTLETVNQVIHELGYKGNPIYLPPEYLRDPGESKVFIAKCEDGELPNPQVILKSGNHLFVKNAEGILVTPSGAELTRLFEKQLGTSFTKKDLPYLKRELPRLLIEDLEILENLEIVEDPHKAETPNLEGDSNHSGRVEDPIIMARMTNSVFKDLAPTIEIGCPVCSAIACALTRVMGAPVTIESVQISDGGETTQATYRILSGSESQRAKKATVETTKVVPQGPSRFSKMVGLYLIALGVIINALMGWIIWYDLTTWGKDIYSILLGSRTGELVGLGIGMKLIYYFAIGSALLTIGLVVALRRRTRKV